MTTSHHELDRIAITVKSHMLLRQLLRENPTLEEIMRNARNETEVLVGVRNWVLDSIKENQDAYAFYKRATHGREAFEKLRWKDFAAIRILDYIDNAGREFEDPNLRGETAVSNPIHLIWLAVAHGTGGAKPFFFKDMLMLFKQFRGDYERQTPSKEQVMKWMERWCSGLDPRIVKLREENKERILKTIIRFIDTGQLNDSKFFFEEGLSNEQKYLKALDWWDNHFSPISELLQQFNGQFW